MHVKFGCKETLLACETLSPAPGLPRSLSTVALGGHRAPGFLLVFSEPLGDSQSCTAFATSVPTALQSLLEPWGLWSSQTGCSKVTRTSSSQSPHEGGQTPLIRWRN